MVGSLPIHGNGTNWEIHDVREITNSSLSLSKAWGTSSEDMYFVGRAGSIAHYNGSSWSKIESGTTTDLISLTPGEGNEIFVSGYDDSNGSSILLKIKEGISEII
jgi:hypothetical protein